MPHIGEWTWEELVAYALSGAQHPAHEGYFPTVRSDSPEIYAATPPGIIRCPSIIRR
jgi:hypothetical protein